MADMVKDLGHQPRYLEQTVGALLAANCLVALPAISRADVRYQATDLASMLATNISRALKDYGMSDVKSRREQVRRNADPFEPARKTKKKSKRSKKPEPADASRGPGDAAE